MMPEALDEMNLKALCKRIRAGLTVEQACALEHLDADEISRRYANPLLDIDRKLRAEVAEAGALYVEELLKALKECRRGAEVKAYVALLESVDPRFKRTASPVAPGMTVIVDIAGSDAGESVITMPVGQEEQREIKITKRKELSPSDEWIQRHKARFGVAEDTQ